MTSVKRLTTYLNEIYPAGYEKTAYTGHQLVNIPTNAVSIMGKYEAVLTHAAYMSRLIYEPNIVMAHAIKLAAYNPIVFNTGLGLLRKQYGRFGKTTLANNIPVDSSVGEGLVIYKKEALVETPCYLQIMDYRGRNGPFAGERVLYVVFRGTVSIKSGLADVNAGLMSLRKILERVSLKGQKGTDVFAQEMAAGVATEAPGVDSFSAHRGFVDNLLPIMGDVCGGIEKMMDVDRIIVTGHSLGGANATVAALILGGFRRAGLITPRLNCITFGAPKCLTDMTRNVFNSLLDQGFLTLDRVAGRTTNLMLGALSAGVAIDVVATIPPHFVHPGYMILKTEIKTQSRTGRSKQISELRQMFAGMPVPGWKDFNSIPTYPEFIGQFNPLGADVYAKVITNNLFGTLYSNTSYKDLYNAIKNLVSVATDVTQDDTMKEAKESTESLNSIPIQKGGGTFTDIYKAATVERGSNHIVYMCHKNISGAACHFGYMGISFNGVAKNLSLSREPLAFFKKPSETMLEYVVATGQQLGGSFKVRKTRKSLKRRRNTRKQKTRKN